MARKPIKGTMSTEHRLRISAGFKKSAEAVNEQSFIRLPDPGWQVATIFNKDKVPVWFCVSKDPNRNFLDQTQRKPNEYGHGKFYGHEGLTLFVSPRVFYDKDEAKEYKNHLIQQWGITTSEDQRPPFEQKGKALPGSLPKRKSPKAKYQPTLFERIKGFFSNLYQRVLDLFNPDRKPAKFGSPAHRAKLSKASSKSRRSPSEETKVKISKAVSKTLTGRTFSEEHRKKISQSVKKTLRKKAREPRVWSDESRLKMMISLEARKAAGLPVGRPKGSTNKPKRKPYTWKSEESRQAACEARSQPRKK